MADTSDSQRPGPPRGDANILYAFDPNTGALNTIIDCDKIQVTRTPDDDTLFYDPPVLCRSRSRGALHTVQLQTS